MKISQTDALILCGGMGTRLRSTIGESQKTMANVGNEPFLNKLIQYLKSQGFRRVILAAGFHGEDVEKYYQSHPQGLKIEISKEKEALGTGGAIKNAESFVKSQNFFVLNGDCFCALDYKSFFDFHVTNKNSATLSVAKIPDTRDYGTILLGPNHTITGFEEKKDVSGGGYVNVGVYCFDKSILSMMPKDKFSIERDFFPQLPAKLGKRFAAFETDQEFLDIGTPERYAKAEEIIRKALSRGTKN